MKKIYLLIVLMAMIIMSSMAFAAETCNTSTNNYIASPKNLTNSSYTALVTLSNNTRFLSLLNVTPTADFTITVNESHAGQATGSYLTLDYRGNSSTLTFTNLSMMNLSDGTFINSTGNWSISGVGQTMALNFLSNLSGTPIAFVYTKTIRAGLDNIMNVTATNISEINWPVSNSTGSWNAETIGVKLYALPSVNSSNILNHNWTITYSTQSRTCISSYSTACSNIFNGVGESFNMAVLVGLILAAVLIITVVTMSFGGSGNVDIKTTVIGIIVGMVMLMIGYVLTASIYQSIC